MASLNTKSKIKIGFISLGCPKNTVDSEIMLRELLDAGYTTTPDEKKADVVIINTCAFIESATKESISNILDMAELKKEGRLKGIIVTGCLTERYRGEVFAELPEVDAVLGVGSIHNITQAVDAVVASFSKESPKYASFEPNDCVRLGGDRLLLTPPYTSYLKIAEGCDNRCTYCAIPSIRGRFRSRPMEDLVKEAVGLEASGAKELTIIAQDITRYGKDLYGRYMLADLLKRLGAETSIPWIRLLYCYPDKITDELIEQIRDNGQVLKYIDLPMQHISENVLRRMNRHGGSEMIRESVRRLREAVPGIVIRTTFITGFPGETEEDFDELCEFVRESRFEHVGVFPYSQEEGTPAASFPDQIDEQVKQDRADILMREQLSISDEWNKSRIGKTIEVLCEGYDKEQKLYVGRSRADALQIDGAVYFRSERNIEPGTFTNVKVTNARDYDLLGQEVPTDFTDRKGAL